MIQKADKDWADFGLAPSGSVATAPAKPVSDEWAAFGIFPTPSWSDRFANIPNAIKQGVADVASAAAGIGAAIAPHLPDFLTPPGIGGDPELFRKEFQRLSLQRAEEYRTAGGENPAVANDPNLLARAVFSSLPKMAVQAAPAIAAEALSAGAATPVVMAQMGGQGFGSTYAQAKEAGADDGHALVAGLLDAGVQAAFAPLAGRAIGRALGAMPKDAAKLVLKALASSAELGGGNAIATSAGNVIAHYLYDDDRKLLEGVAPSLVTGATAGLFGFLASAAARGGVKSDTSDTSAPAEATTPPTAQEAPGTPQPAQAAEVKAEPVEQLQAKPEAAPTQELLTESTPQDRTKVGDKPLWEMSHEELIAAEAQQRLVDKAREVNILGEEGAAEWAKLHKQMNSSNNERSDAAYDRIQEIEAALPKSKVDELYGIDEPGAGADDIADYAKAIERTFPGQTEAHVAEGITYMLMKLGHAPSDPAEMTHEQRLAMVTIRAAGEHATALGLDTQKISDLALENAASKFPDPEDAAFVLERWLKPKGPKRLQSPEGGGSAPDQPSGAAPGLDQPVEAAAPTSIKNETVEAERAVRGLEAPPKGEARTRELVDQEAKARLRDDPLAGSKLTDSILENPRPISDTDAHVLLRERVRLSNRRDQLETLADEAKAKALPGHDVAKQIHDLNQEIDRNDRASHLAGTTNAQALAARAAMMKQDYTLAAQERRVRAARGGEALTAELQAQVKRLTTEVKEKQRQIDQAALKKEVAARGKSVRPERIKQLREEIDDIFHQLVQHSGRARSGLDVDTLALVTKLATKHIELGYHEFAGWAEEVVARAGEHVKPYLEQAWAKANEDPKLKAFKERTSAELEKVKERTFYAEHGVDIARKAPSKLILDPEANRLQAELETAKRKLDAIVRNEALKQQGGAKKAVRVGKEILDVQRALKASFDFSAMLRQGAMLTAAHPITSIREHLPEMVRATFSPKRAMELDTAIRNRPLAKFAEQSGLDITHHGDGLGPAEENLQSSWAEKIPGVAASNRGFTTYRNLQAASAFDNYVRAFPGTPTPEQGRQLAAAVNVFTGRGNITNGKTAATIDAAARVIWSPRLLISRMQLLSGQPLWWKADPAASKLIAKTYARSLTALATTYALAKMAGYKVEDDPRSSKAGKIQIGDTYVDPLAGLQQVAVFTTRLATGETTTGKGEVKPIRGPDVKFNDTTTSDVISHFARSKLTPVLGTAWDLLAGENAVGEPVTAASAASDAVTPLSARDIYDEMRHQDVPEGVAIAVLSLLGAGVQTYGQRGDLRTYRGTQAKIHEELSDPLKKIHQDFLDNVDDGRENPDLKSAASFYARVVTQSQKELEAAKSPEEKESALKRMTEAMLRFNAMARKAKL